MKRFSEFFEFVKRQRDHEGNTLAVSRLLTDGGGEYGGKADANHADAETAKVLNEFSKVCSLNAIKHTFTSAHTPALNGLAERFNRTASEDARALLRDMSVSPKLWSYAVQYTVWLRNRIPHSALGGLTLIIYCTTNLLASGWLASLAALAGRMTIRMRASRR